MFDSAYRGGSGDFFISIDTDEYMGCGLCIKACPVFVVEEIPYCWGRSDAHQEEKQAYSVVLSEMWGNTGDLNDLS